MPYLAPVIETLKQLGDYTDGELRAALVASLFTVFVKAENGYGLEPDATGAAATTPAQTGDLTRLGSGAIVELNPGDDISTANPGRPNTAFDPFVQALLRQIGSALEIPFELLIKHFTSSYSASRAALLEAWRFFKGRRSWLAAMFCQPIYEAWMDEAVARGRIAASGYFEDPAIRAAYLRCEWIGDSQGQIDPLKEVTAAEKRLALLLSTYSDETVALSGMDWEDVVARRSREEKVIDAAGLRAVLVDASSVAAPVDPMGPEEAMPGVPQGAPTPENH
jgi:lambda family phage portal protein